ncbi:oxidoreductase [Sphingobium sp. 22B]|uniref:quinone oxidoreductase family protein n=1 Tax=unclassified Sphingobium TaxID=2611147 RepID=UPI0007846034|nr:MULTISPECIES: zinc-binding alcohol dehydrogenase family protein [unclassified Sphingobium]KXU30485.1 oxidoreductase [Sphingobium sp. AM]KYC30744.1 oxidoreductase [Sphingobium sp. 22B]OAP30043.1 oxidoreductase [Sphingobium sp. 20006FA]
MKDSQNGVTRRLRLTEKANDASSVRLPVESDVRLEVKPDQVLVEIACAAVNPSDVKAAIGMMPYAVWPRTPGRDFSGRIVEGPSELVGVEVWGSSGDFGIRCDGTHASHIVLDLDCVSQKPSNISLLEAGAAGVPFVTAWEGLRRAGFPQKGDTVLVFGANGKVGQATMQIVTLLGARAIGVTRRDEPYIGHANAPVEMIDASAVNVADAVRDLTDGKGAGLIYNTVGSPYFEAASDSLAKRGKQILIGTIDRVVPFDILKFYRGQHEYIGIDTLSLSTRDTVAMLTAMTPHFESGALRPFSVGQSSIHALEDASSAYAKVMQSDRDRIVLVPR